MSDENVLYRRVVRGKRTRYEPVGLDAIEFPGPLRQGAHLLVVGPGWASARHDIDPAHAALLAAAHTAREAMMVAVHEATRLRPDRRETTPQERIAWGAFRDSLRAQGVEEPRALLFDGVSIRDVVDAGIAALMAAATAAPYPAGCAARCPKDCAHSVECRGDER